MEITFNTPALLFPAISLLLLAYTNRYLALANLIRKLHDEYTRGEKNNFLLRQIKILRVRINLVSQMQTLGVFSFLCCVVTMYSVYKEWGGITNYAFAASLLSRIERRINDQVKWVFGVINQVSHGAGLAQANRFVNRFWREIVEPPSHLRQSDGSTPRPIRRLLLCG